ncbi:MAG: cation:proton antiporter [Bacteroidaceae bacterium]|nr:cation:proton antiporter [Bacteroidaceae bacterium]
MTLPVDNPTWIFFIVLMIILFAPMIMRRLHIPYILGMILSGVIIGPYGFNILANDSSFEIFGQVGLYYIMFLAALEMDTRSLVRNVQKYLFFGLTTFIIPFLMAYIASQIWLNYSLEQGLMFASILSSNTLIAYPIVSRYGLGKEKCVNLSVGGTMIALLLSLIIVAGVATSFDKGDGFLSWCIFTLKILLFGVGAILFIPRLTRVFLRYYSDSVSQFIFVLSVMFLSAAMAEVCGIQGVLGAFLSGLILNRYIPHVSPLMNRIEFVGNALFIPYFLIGVGMMINMQSLFSGMETIKVVIVMVMIGTIGKALAAYITNYLLHMPKSNGHMMFGLTSAHAAGSIAIIMVGTRLEIAPGVFLMNDDILNGVVIMILITCVISSFITERASKTLAMESKEITNAMTDIIGNDDEKIMVPVKSEASAEKLVDLAALMLNRTLNRGIIALNVVYDDADSALKQREGRIMLERLMKQADSMDMRMQTQSRLATNVANGIVHAFKEYDASEIIVGSHEIEDFRNNSLGNTVDSLIAQLNRQIIITRILRPLNTIRMMDIIVPDKAEFEPGFYRWVEKLSRIAENLSCRITCYGSGKAVEMMCNYIHHRHNKISMNRAELSFFEDLPSLTGEIKTDHLMVVVVARKGTLSYTSQFEKLSLFIEKYYSDRSVMVIYPDQYGQPIDEISFAAPQEQDAKSVWAIFRRFFTKRK